MISKKYIICCKARELNMEILKLALNESIVQFGNLNPATVAISQKLDREILKNMVI